MNWYYKLLEFNIVGKINFFVWIRCIIFVKKRKERYLYVFELVVCCCFFVCKGYLK